MYTCIDKSMQIVLERGSIYRYLIHMHARCFSHNPNIPIFPPGIATDFVYDNGIVEVHVGLYTICVMVKL